MENKTNVATSDFLSKVVKANRSDLVTIDELKISLHERGFGILLMLFTLPVSVPIPYIPGITTLFAIPIIFLSVQMVLGFEFPWLPKWLTKISIKRKILRYAILKSSPILKKVEKLLKPRLSLITSGHGHQIIGFFATIFAVCIALPLPFTNFIPALGIIAMSLGLLSRDGFIILIGIVIGVIGTIFTLAIIILGKKIVIGILNKFFF